MRYWLLLLFTLGAAQPAFAAGEGSGDGGTDEGTEAPAPEPDC